MEYFIGLIVLLLVPEILNSVIDAVKEWEELTK
jgi:diacylglycerol kinase